jgi:putative addiction module component (TIGR02574 family)
MNTMISDLGIDRLGSSERAQLALDIWESLGLDRPLPLLNNEQRIELDRRDAEMEANPSLAMTWDEIRDHVEGRQ